MGGVFFVLGMLSSLGLAFTWKRSQEVWIEKPGTVIESYLREGSRKTRKKRSVSHTPAYEVRLRYRYGIEGRNLSGDAKALRQPEDDEDRRQAQAIVEGYQAGDTLPVFHHPSEVGKSRLTAKESRIEFVLDIMFSALFLSFGGIILAFARWLLRRNRQEHPAMPS